MQKGSNEVNCPFWFRMGLIDLDHVNRGDFKNGEGIGWIAHEQAFQIEDGKTPAIHTQNCTTIISQKWKFRVCEGDRFRLEMDLSKRSITAFYNEKPVGVILEEIPKAIILAASVRNRDIALETTLFEIV